MKPVVILGVTGSVAAYRSADIARDLMREGYEVRVCLTRSAKQFVTPTLFEALTGQPCLVDIFDEPVRGEMAHITWARDAKLVLVCPATANAITTIANGQSQDMLTTIISATNAQLIIAPAMNPQMYAQESLQTAIKTLKQRGMIFIEPSEGDVACGEHGQGKLASSTKIVETVKQAVYASQLLTGMNVLISAGPTQEPIDSVRYISNRSSGKMGYALADMAQKMGANVTLISGPTHLISPPLIKTIHVTTAEDMKQACLMSAKEADLFISSAAVADIRLQSASPQKLKKEELQVLRFEQTPDILKEIHSAIPQLPLVGFAAETENWEKNALNKMKSKNLFAIAVNDVSRQDVGFNSDENELTVFFNDETSHFLEKASKTIIARNLLELVAAKLKKQKSP